MVSKWPEVIKKYNNKKDSEAFEGVKEIIKAIRNIRSNMNVIPSRTINIQLILHCDEKLINNSKDYIHKLAGVESIQFINDKADVDTKVITAVTNMAEIFIPMGDLVDIDKEIERLTKELRDNDKEIARSNGMLSNPRFLEKAPKDVIDAEKKKLQQYNEKKERLIERIETLK